MTTSNISGPAYKGKAACLNHSRNRSSARYGHARKTHPISAKTKDDFTLQKKLSEKRHLQTINAPYNLKIAP
jgi:RNase adaptor protein for sRNA GlmZ degradation